MSKTDPYAVTRVKTTVGCTKNQGSWPQANSVALRQHLQQSGNIKCAIIEARCYSSDVPQGELEVLCMLDFSRRCRS